MVRMDAIRRFAARYHLGGGLESPLTSPSVSCAVASARAFLAVLGLAFAVAGLAVAWIFDRLTGLGILIVGAFLLILPFTRSREDE